MVIARRIADPGCAAAALGRADLHVWVLGLDVPPARLGPMRRILAPDERTRADGFAFEMHRRRFIAGRAHLRMLLARYLGRDPRALRFRYGAHGKPALATGSGDPALAFNVSHSEGLGVYAITRCGNVGVDVERVRALPDAAAIGRDVFTREERDALQSTPGDERLAAWFRCWTRKEAYLKGVGVGFACLPCEVAVGCGGADEAGFAPVRGANGEHRQWRVLDLLIDDHVAAAVASDASPAVSCWRCDDAAWEMARGAPIRSSRRGRQAPPPVDTIPAP